MTTDPQIRAIATDSATVAQFAAAMCSHDSWEWQSILSEVQDLDECKRLLSAMSGLFISLTTAMCERTGEDPAAWLHKVALEQIAVAESLQDE
jgi:hypothetical protein